MIEIGYLLKVKDSLSVRFEAEQEIRKSSSEIIQQNYQKFTNEDLFFPQNENKIENEELKASLREMGEFFDFSEEVLFKFESTNTETIEEEELKYYLTEEDWNSEFTQLNGKRIGIVDTGCSVDLKNIEKKWNIVQQSEDITDEHGHGTAIALILSTIAPNSKLFIAKVSRAIKGVREIYATGSNICRGLDQMREWEVDVVILSLTVKPEFNGTYLRSLKDWETLVPLTYSTFRNSLLALKNNNVYVCCAAGNLSRYHELEQFPALFRNDPELMPFVLNVGAHDIRLSPKFNPIHELNCLGYHILVKSPPLHSAHSSQTVYFYRENNDNNNNNNNNNNINVCNNDNEKKEGEVYYICDGSSFAVPFAALKILSILSKEQLLAALPPSTLKSGARIYSVKYNNCNRARSQSLPIMPTSSIAN